jgi:hypothetical protein
MGSLLHLMLLALLGLVCFDTEDLDDIIIPTPTVSRGIFGKCLIRSTFLCSRISFYPNSCATFQLELLLSGDIELNPGPSHHSESVYDKPSIIYTRTQLLELGLNCTKLPVSLPTWININNIGIQSTPSTHRGSKGTRHNYTRTLFPPTVTRVNKNPQSKKLFNLCHWNARSVGNKIRPICDYVTNFNVDLMLFSETWLTHDDPVTIGELTPPGYSYINVPRKNCTSGGGVGALFKSQLKLSLILEPALNIQTFEYAILSDTSRSVNFVVVYRPPPSTTNKLKTSDFLKEFDIFIDHLNISPGKLLLLGDFNIHYDCPGKSDVSHVADTLASSGLLQHVKGPTHKHGHTLDLVITRDNENILCTLRTGSELISDHAVISCLVDICKPTTSRVTSTTRNYQKFDDAAFSADLSQNLELLHVSATDDINIVVNEFDAAVTCALDVHAPLSTRTRSMKHRPKWYNNTIDDARRERRRCERKYRKSRTENDKRIFMTAKLAVTKTLVDAKSVYYKDRLNSCTSKEMHRTLAELMNKNIRIFPDADSSSSLANEFCNFFINKVKKIRTFIDDCGVSCPELMLDTHAKPSCRLSNFKLLSEDAMLAIINKSATKSCALDPLPTWLLKRHLPTLLPTITTIVNASLKSGIFPSVLSTASITPIIKKPSLNRNELRNYRPVSNIRYLGKLIEKAVSSQLVEYIESNNLAEPLQSAYRSGHGTETALVSVQNNILQALDQQKAVFLVLLDLSAAFDTLDFDIMLQRFRDRYGITELALDWFNSYFKHRRCHVSIDGMNSEDLDLDHGVPQGSVIGPLGFTMYVRPIGDVLRRHGVQFHMYADDIQIYLTCDPSKPGEIVNTLSKLSQCINEVQQWMLVNKLKLNQDKTEFIIIASSHHHHLLQNTDLLLDNDTIRPSSSVRNLGVVFDKCMSMTDHVTAISKSVNYHLRNLNKIRRYIDTDTCHAAVRSLVSSRLDYCNSLLNGITVKNMNRLQCLQNKAARLVFMLPKRTHTSPLLRELHWLRIPQRVQYKTLTLVYKAIHDEAPKYISDMLHVRESSYNFRSSCRIMFNVPLTKKRVGDSAFNYIAPKLWNSIPHMLANLASRNQFKKKLKTHLFM